MHAKGTDHHYSVPHITGANAVIAVSSLLFFLILLLFLIVNATPTQAQTYRVLYTFSGRQDGGSPRAGLSMDAAGTLYGITTQGGNFGGPITGGICQSEDGCGTVFKLSPNGSGWTLTRLHAFKGKDGAFPWGGVSFGPDGNLYGTTWSGGGPGGNIWGAGTVFSLRPPSAPCKTTQCEWTHTVLYRFSGWSDGAGPGSGMLLIDQSGDLYGTTAFGGANSWGTVYKLTHSPDGWVESVLFSFSDGPDGSEPNSGVVFDNSGNLVGTTNTGGEYNCPGDSCGTLFQLRRSGDEWTEQVLHDFRGGDDGYWPRSAPIVDGVGNLIGTTINGGSGGGGTVYMLSPSGSGWSFTTLYAFTGFNSGPSDSLIMDAAGNLYGTTYEDGAYGHGNVFKLSPSLNGWQYTSLYDFTGGSDGGLPESRVLLDSRGNLFGTTTGGGTGSCNPNWAGCGVVWEITP